MLIKRINSIKKFGIYQDFKWNGDTPEFEVRNIIYGWNYSGKTTLSRFFSLLPNIDSESAKTIGFSVKAINDNGETIQSESAINNLPIYTFNSDYIEQNLHFEMTDNPKIKGILFDIGEESGEKRQELNETRTALHELDKWISSNHNFIEAFTYFDKIFTQEAKVIKNDVFESQIEFNRSHLKRIIDLLDLSKLDKYIISDSKLLSQTRANALAKQAKESIVFQTLSIDLTGIVKRTNEILVYQPQRIQDEAILGSASEMYEWGKVGLRFYLLNPTIKRCGFCGNPLTNDRIQELNRFYSNEAAQLRTSINNLKEELAIILGNIKTHVSQMPHPNDVIESSRSLYEQACIGYKSCLSELSCFMGSLIDSLIKKEEQFLFESILQLDIPNNLESKYFAAVEMIIASIKSHNDVISNFASIKKQAIETLKCHWVARILKEKGYIQAKRNKERQEKEIAAKEKEKESLSIKYKELQAELKSLAKGRENLNNFIQLFLGRMDLEIHTTDDDYFILKRGTEIASKLSEGEKTAIALSYFLVSLESIKNDNALKNAIIFIDDPISSLDANHIAQVSSLINSFFFERDASGKIRENFAQLFISTHNFEFFSFIRDANNIKRQPKKGKQGSRCALYMLKRTSENSVDIQRLPATFSNYNSEYLYLFSEIYYYYRSKCPEDKSYLMPNVIRRFLEIYTRIKLPGNQDEIDNRIKILMGDGVNELKVLHYFSHLQR